MRLAGHKHSAPDHGLGHAPPQHAPPWGRAIHCTKPACPCQPNAAGTTGTDHKWPPRPNTSNSRTSRQLGYEDDGQPTKPAKHSAGNNVTTSQRDTSNPDEPQQNTPMQKKQHRGRPTATKRGRPGAYGLPHNPRQADQLKLRRQGSNTTRRAHPGRDTVTTTCNRPAAPNREDNKDNTRLCQRRLHRDRPNGEQGDRKAANTTMHQPNSCRDNDPTINRPHASRPTSNQPGMQGWNQERRPMG